MSNPNDDKIQILADSARGIYIPQHFAESVIVEEWGLDPESWEVQTIESGPDNAQYWDAWHQILDSARFTDSDGHEWSLYQDGDLYAIRDDYDPESA